MPPGQSNSCPWDLNTHHRHCVFITFFFYNIFILACETEPVHQCLSIQQPVGMATTLPCGNWQDAFSIVTTRNTECVTPINQLTLLTPALAVAWCNSNSRYALQPDSDCTLSNNPLPGKRQQSTEKGSDWTYYQNGWQNMSMDERSYVDCFFLFLPVIVQAIWKNLGSINHTSLGFLKDLTSSMFVYTETKNTA